METPVPSTFASTCVGLILAPVSADRPTVAVKGPTETEAPEPELEDPDPAPTANRDTSFYLMLKDDCRTIIPEDKKFCDVEIRRIYFEKRNHENDIKKNLI